MPRHNVGALAAVSLCLSAAMAHADWDWTIYPDLYSAMDQFQRAEYDKAAAETRRVYNAQPDIHNARTAREVALQWEKFRVQYESELDPGTVAHVTFMKGRCLQRSQDRHTAIRAYTEVLDFFPDELWVAAPALYFRGVAHFENGDDPKGLADFRAMNDDPDYRLHALAAGALRRLAEEEWVNGDTLSTRAHWQDIHARFKSTNPSEADAAGVQLMDEFIREQQYEDLVAWALPEAERDNSDARRQLAQRVRGRAVANFGTDWRKYDGEQDAVRRADKQAFYEWFCAQRPHYVNAGHAWTFLGDVIGWIGAQGSGAEDVPRYLDEAVVLAGKEDLSVAERDNRYAWICGMYWGRGQRPSALEMLSFIKDRGRALWMKYDYVGNRAGDWQAAMVILDKITELDPQAHGTRVLREKARVYHDVLKDYPTAIQLYYTLNEPPATLWKIQSCYRMLGEKEKAINTLKEITSMFPGDAAGATFTQAEYMREDEREALAVALYRRILAHPDWTRTHEASLAHQRLEDLGEKTGGGVIYED